MTTSQDDIDSGHGEPPRLDGQSCLTVAGLIKDLDDAAETMNWLARRVGRYRALLYQLADEKKIPKRAEIEAFERGL